MRSDKVYWACVSALFVAVLFFLSWRISECDKKNCPAEHEAKWSRDLGCVCVETEE